MVDGGGARWFEAPEGAQLGCRRLFMPAYWWQPQSQREAPRPDTIQPALSFQGSGGMTEPPKDPQPQDHGKKLFVAWGVLVAVAVAVMLMTR